MGRAQTMRCGTAVAIWALYFLLFCWCQDHDGAFLAEIQAQAEFKAQARAEEQANLDASGWYHNLMGNLAHPRTKHHDADAVFETLKAKLEPKNHGTESQDLSRMDDELGESNELQGG